LNGTEDEPNTGTHILQILGLQASPILHPKIREEARAEVRGLKWRWGEPNKNWVRRRSVYGFSLFLISVLTKPRKILTNQPFTE
jgi:hypothetical protein